MRVICSQNVAIVAAIPPYVHSLARSFIGFGPFRVGLLRLGLLRAIVVDVSSGWRFCLAYIIDFLAGTFGAQKNLDNAMRVLFYFATAAWLAGIFNLIPAFPPGNSSACTVLICCTPALPIDEPAADKALVYAIAVIVCAIIVWIIIFSIPALLFGTDIAADQGNALTCPSAGRPHSSVLPRLWHWRRCHSADKVGKRPGLSEMLNA